MVVVCSDVGKRTLRPQNQVAACDCSLFSLLVCRPMLFLGFKTIDEDLDEDLYEAFSSHGWSRSDEVVLRGMVRRYA